MLSPPDNEHELDENNTIRGNDYDSSDGISIAMDNLSGVGQGRGQDNDLVGCPIDNIAYFGMLSRMVG